MAFPATRMRRLRRTGVLRGLTRETELSPSHLIQPLFVTAGSDVRADVPSMPGVTDPAGLLDDEGIVQMAIRALKEADPELTVIADEHDLHGDDRAVLYSSTEYKKIRLRYFTDEYADWEREHGGLA